MEPLIRNLVPSDKALITQIAHWYHAEWETPMERTERQLGLLPNEQVMFHSVLLQDDQLIATGGVYTDVGVLRVHPYLKAFSPWLAMFYTGEPFRGKGFGEKLLVSIEQQVKQLGIPRFYLYTFTAERLYARCGWQTFDQVMYKGHETVVMKKEL